jgi:D-3-phosphoglycerate dehydrogenase
VDSQRGACYNFSASFCGGTKKQKGGLNSNVPLAGVDDVANHAVALMLACQRRLFQMDGSVRRGEYDWEVMRPMYNP